MKKTSTALVLTFFCALGCSKGVVPTSEAPTAEKKAYCQELSENKDQGCKACAGVSYCSWTQTTSPSEGTCAFEDEVLAPPAISSPLHCPVPKL